MTQTPSPWSDGRRRTRVQVTDKNRVPRPARSGTASPSGPMSRAIADQRSASAANVSRPRYRRRAATRLAGRPWQGTWRGLRLAIRAQTAVSPPVRSRRPMLRVRSCPEFRDVAWCRAGLSVGPYTLTPVEGAKTRTARAERTREPVTRRDVLTHSAELFARHGYKATNLRMVADRLGVTRQALYYHFDTKAEILGALFDEQMTALEATAAAAEPVGNEPRFSAIVRGHLKVILGNPDLTAVLVHERPEADRIDGLRARQRRRAYTSQIAAAYAEGVAEGKLRAIDPNRAANLVFGAANSVTMWYHPQRSSASPTQVAEDILSLLSSGFLIGRSRRSPKMTDLDSPS